MLETNVHFPTDINLLRDALRKVITLTAQWCDDLGLTDWRQSVYNVNHVKRLMRSAQNKKRSKATSAARVEQNKALIVTAHQQYLKVAPAYLDKARQTLTLIEAQGLADLIAWVRKSEIEKFMTHADRQIDPIHRRVILGEVIAPDEKVFSILNRTPNGSARGKPASRWNWASRCASSKTSTHSSCTIR